MASNNPNKTRSIDKNVVIIPKMHCSVRVYLDDFSDISIGTLSFFANNFCVLDNGRRVIIFSDEEDNVGTEIKFCYPVPVIIDEHGYTKYKAA